MKSFRPTSRFALRGAARVSVAWLVVCIFLMLAAMIFAYVGLDGKAKAEAAAAEAETARAEAAAKSAEDQKALAELSKSVGFYDAAAAARSDLTTLNATLEQLRASFPDLGPDVKTLSDALPLIEQAYAARAQELATERDAKNALASQMKTLEDSLREALRQKDTQIADLQRQVQDGEANAAQKVAELEGRIAALNTQRNQLDADLRAARATSDEQRRKLEDEITTMQVRNKSLSDQMAFTKEPEKADGRLLAVSKDLALGWIDVGARNRLARGVSFNVVSGRVGSKDVKAMAVVTNVEDRRAEVRFTEVADPYNPPVPGDVIYNPLYDPTGERTAVLAGRFSGQFNEAELKVLLSQMGITVQDKLTLDTDYLIVGSELYADPETNEPLDEPLQVTDLPIYKDAESKGVNIISIKDLRTYFQAL
jgi:predicted  nucleic acid-binding Zn-ribbon protein